MSTYQLGRSWVTRIEDGLSIPLDPANRDYQDFLAWVASGNTPLPYVEPYDATGAGLARIARKEAAKQRQAQKLAALGKDLEALKLLNNL